jgi:Sigma-70 region 2
MRPSAEPAEDLSGLFRAHHLELVRLAAFVIGDVAAGEDVVQDVFVRLHQRWDSLAVQRDPLPYLPPHRPVARSGVSTFPMVTSSIGLPIAPPVSGPS